MKKELTVKIGADINELAKRLEETNKKLNKLPPEKTKKIEAILAENDINDLCKPL